MKGSPIQLHQRVIWETATATATATGSAIGRQFDEWKVAPLRFGEIVKKTRGGKARQIDFLFHF